jgi:SAM-dependent methyltransferase
MRPDPIDLLFGGMEKLGPGGDAHTLHVLGLLPGSELHVIVDAGCGTGRQTLVLARALGRRIQAIDTHAPFLDELARRSRKAGIGHLVRVLCMDMLHVPDLFRDIDLLWSEGAAYNVGFCHALETWAPAVKPGGFVVVSELSWLGERMPRAAAEFFASAYPEMQPVHENAARARGAGYEVLETYALPPEAWVEGYYELLEPRASALADHPDASVRRLAAETLEEIGVFERSEESYGYVFYILRRARAGRGPAGA